jgi:hypothetical protein
LKTMQAVFFFWLSLSLFKMHRLINKAVRHI